MRSAMTNCTRGGSLPTGWSARAEWKLNVAPTMTTDIAAASVQPFRIHSMRRFLTQHSCRLGSQIRLSNSGVPDDVHLALPSGTQLCESPSSGCGIGRSLVLSPAGRGLVY
jgi:hypothetical protein